MATLAIASAGAFAGNSLITGTVLGMTGSQIGFMAAGMLANYFLKPKGPDLKGPRLDDAVYTGVVEGTDIPILYGGGRVTGKPIWIKTPPKEVKNKEDIGGKGGFGGGGTSTTYSYYQDYMVSFGEYICDKPRKVWLNNELVYDASGSNAEVTNVKFSFTWYTGEDDSVDAIIEQDVGAGNSPSYKGRCVMMIEGLPLTENYGNRLPVIEAELQTTGTLTTSLTTYNMGVSDAGTDYTATSLLIVHPFDNTYLSTPTQFGTTVGERVFYTDMASQQSYQIFSRVFRPILSLVWFSDIGLDGPHPQYFIYSEKDNVGSSAVFYLVKYPSGRLLGTYAFTAAGGAIFGEESKLFLIWSQSDTGSNIGLFDKALMAQDPTDVFNVNTLLGDTGWTSNQFSQCATTIDWLNSTWGMVAKKSGASVKYFVFDVSTGTATLTQKSDPFLSMSATQSDDFTISGLGTGVQNPGIYVAENNEIWFPYETTATVSGYDTGLLILNATTGAYVDNIDFVEEGYTANTSYFGISSGYPHLTFERQQRRIWCTMSVTGDVISVQVDSRNVDVYPNASTGSSWTVSYPNRNSIWGGLVSNKEYLVRERKMNVMGVGDVKISDILIDIFGRVGYTAAEYDVSTLTSKTIGGFLRGTRHSGRSDTEMLLGLAQADGVQSGYKLKFPLRGGASVLTIPEDDLAAQEVKGEIKPKELNIITDPTGIEIPKVVELTYNSVNNNYNKGIAQSYIATGHSDSNEETQLPVSLTDQKAFELAEIIHQQMSTGKTSSFSLPIKYTYLEPTDVIDVPKGGENHRIRLTKVVRGVNWLLKCEGVIDNASDFTSTAIVPGVDDFISTIQTKQLPTGLIFDGPLLFDSHSDHPGPYLASYVSGSTYPPSLWFYSIDNSVYANIFTQDSQPLVGQTIGIYNRDHWEEWDDATEIYINVIADGTLSSSTKSAILADPTINAFAYGEQGRWEYLNAATITTVQTSPNKILKLTNLLRGRRGTNNNITTHLEKDLIVQLSTVLQRQTLQNSQIGNDFYYKVVRSGEAVSDFNSISYTNEGLQLYPYTVINLAPVDDAGAIDTTWTRRTRKGGSLGGTNTLTDGVGGPISEDALEYEIEYRTVLNDTFLRSETGLTTESATYSAANQTTDGVDLLGQIYVDVYQISAVVGRGFRSRKLYDKGWGKLISFGLEYGAVGIMPLDDADGASAREVVSGTTPGTYTSASLSDALSSDNLGGLDGDSTGYMKTGTTLSSLLATENQVTVILFTTGVGATNDRLLELTQGGATSMLEIYWSTATAIGLKWSPKSSVAGITQTFTDTTAESTDRILMISTTMDLNGVYNINGFVNGVQELTYSGSTGHASYNSTIQTETRDSAYNDTVNGTMASTPGNLKSTGATGFVMVFDKILTTTEQRDLYRRAFQTYDELIEEQISLHTYAKFTSGTGATNSGYDFTNSGMTTGVASITCASEFSLESTATTSDFLYKTEPVGWMVDECTVEFFFYLNTALTGTHYLFSIEPRDWNGSVKKGFHIVADSTNGLRCLLGEGAGTFTTVDAATANISINTLYHIACTLHPTNGIKLYLNGTEIANNSGTAITPDWTDGASGNPNPSVAYINTENDSFTDATAADGTGAIAHYAEFAFYVSELSATTLLSHYRRGAGIVV